MGGARTRSFLVTLTKLSYPALVGRRIRTFVLQVVGDNIGSAAYRTTSQYDTMAPFETLIRS